MSVNLELYGYYVFTHGGRRVLMVLSPTDPAAVRKAIGVDEGVNVKSGSGQLVQLHERHSGALDRIVETHNIRILSKPEWDVRKASLNRTIYR